MQNILVGAQVRAGIGVHIPGRQQTGILRWLRRIGRGVLEETGCFEPNNMICVIIVFTQKCEWVFVRKRL